MNSYFELISHLGVLAQMAITIPLIVLFVLGLVFGLGKLGDLADRGIDRLVPEDRKLYNK